MNFLASKIGIRYSYARRGSNFIGLNAILSVIGISIGIATLIVVLSVMNGVISDVRDRLLAMTAQVSIRPRFSETLNPEFDPSRYLTSPEIIAYAPYTQGQGLIGIGKSYQGILLHGLDPEEEGKISEVYANIDEDVRQQLKAGAWNIILGEGLAQSLNLKIGDKITIIVPKVSTTAAGLMPRMKRFTFIGTFKSGHYQYDHQFTMLHSEDARNLLQYSEGYTGYQIKIKDAMQAPFIREALNEELPIEAYASDWSRDQAVYFNAVQMEKNAMFIILCLIVIVAAFGLLSSMYMVVSEKRRDIAILRTMGMQRGQIAQIFISQGLVFGLIGVFFGVLLGVIITLNIPHLMNLLERLTGYEIPPQLYLVDQLSAKIEPNIVISISAITLIMTLIFSLIPAIIAARTEPARALSQE